MKPSRRAETLIINRELKDLLNALIGDKAISKYMLRKSGLKQEILVLNKDKLTSIELDSMLNTVIKTTTQMTTEDFNIIITVDESKYNNYLNEVQVV